MGKAVLKILFGALLFQHVITAPSDVNLEDIAEVTKAQESNDEKPVTLQDEPASGPPPQNQRQKRWYNYFGFPPVNSFPPFNQNFYNRDEPFSTSAFGQPDPLVLIHRRLQDISNSFRQPPPPQFPSGFPHYPGFVPIFYIPQVGCACTPNDVPQRPTNNNTPATEAPNNDRNQTDNPGVNNRWPEMEDDRQNWGIVPDDPGQEVDVEEDDGDGGRPISFDPIRPDRPVSKPAPPVEHGSVEGNINTGTVGSGNAGSGSSNSNSGPAATTFRPPQRPSNSGLQPPSNSGLQPPSNCDSAILRCCHLPQVTYDCFAYQGCPDPSSYGNPCDSGVISRVIDRFLRFYGQRNNG